MNLLEALKQIAEKTDKKPSAASAQYYMPSVDQKSSGSALAGYFGDRLPSGLPLPDSLLNEMYRQTRDAQMGPGHTNQLRYNPDAVERFLADQPVSKNIDDRRGEIQPTDEPYDLAALDASDLKLDPNDLLAKLLGINSIRPQSMAFDPVPMPRPRPR